MKRNIESRFYGERKMHNRNGLALGVAWGEKERSQVVKRRGCAEDPVSLREGMWREG